MRRLVLLPALVGLALLAPPRGRAAPGGDDAPAAPVRSRETVVRVPRSFTEVRLSVAALEKAWPGWRAAGGFVQVGESLSPVFPKDGAVTFAVRDAGVTALAAGAFLAGGSDFRRGLVDPVDTIGPGLERFVWEGANAFGAVASADPDVYDHELPTWFAGKLEPRQAVTVRFPPSLPALRPGTTTATLALRVVATHTGPVAIRATIGDTPIGTITRPRATGGATFAWTVPAAAWPTLASGGAVTFADETAEVVRPDDPHDTSDDVGTSWLVRATLDAATVPGTTRYAAEEPGVFRALARVGDEALETIEADPVPDEAAQADELIVAVPTLVDGARRLAAHRTAHGVRAVVVATPALGADPAAGLRALLAGSTARYLLLVGDADRDRVTPDTIPACYARTLYNGATATDRPYGLAADGTPRAVVGRLPFADPRALDAYVDRVIRAETKPPVDATRKAVAFITSEGRFGPRIDTLLENLFTQVVATHIPPCYDVSVTFARAKSDYGWPAPAFNDKVIDTLNAGALFFTYVGHGWWNGFDDLRVDGRRFPILKSEHVDRVGVRGTPPAMFVIACTTALFDDPQIRSVGERLLDRPEGPLAYVGATRVCHPAWNSIVGRQLAMEMFRRGGSHRLGDVLGAAVASALGPIPEGDGMRRVIEAGAAMVLRDGKADLARLKREGAAMYVLLGDPAVALPFPQDDLAVTAERVPEGVRVTARGAFPDGAEIALTVDVPRTTPLPFVRDPAWSVEETMRRRHDRANEKTLARATVAAAGGVASAVLPVADTRRGDRLLATASAVYGDDVHLGWAESPAPK